MITLEKKTMGRKTVIESIQRRFQDRHLDGAVLNVLEEGTRQEEDHWYIAVQPDKEPTSKHDYYNVLAEVETEMLIQENVLVLMVPTAARQ